MLLFDSLVPFVVVDVMFFAFNNVRLPMLQAMVSARTTAETSNSAMGFYQSMNSLGSIFGALFAGLIYDANPMLPFILAFAAFVVAMFFSVMYVGKYKKEKSQNA